jgi:hypothetical protein
MPPNSRRRLFEVRTSQGHPLTQPIIWHSDGGDTRRDLQLDLNSHAEHLLDRFHGPCGWPSQPYSGLTCRLCYRDGCLMTPKVCLFCLKTSKNSHIAHMYVYRHRV